MKTLNHEEHTVEIYEGDNSDEIFITNSKISFENFKTPSKEFVAYLHPDVKIIPFCSKCLEVRNAF